MEMFHRFYFKKVFCIQTYYVKSNYIICLKCPVCTEKKNSIITIKQGWSQFTLQFRKSIIIYSEIPKVVIIIINL